MNKAFWSHFEHFGRFWEKFICSSLPAKLIEEFPVDYWEVSSNSVIQPFSSEGGGGGGGLDKELGVAKGQDLALQWGGFCQQHMAAILDIKYPQTPWFAYFPATPSFKGHNYVFQISQPAKICLKNRYFEEQMQSKDRTQFETELFLLTLFSFITESSRTI